MNKIGHIEINIEGFRGNQELSPDNYDIREIMTMIENAENLLFPFDKKDRPVLSYKIEEGSVKHIFKTSVQFIIGFNAILGQISTSQSIDFLDQPTARALQNIQELSMKNDLNFVITTSVPGSNSLSINKTTQLFKTESLWIDAEFYFYGKLVNAGGKEKANIHILTNELGTLRIDTPISFLEKYEENILYKTFGIRAIGKQHVETGEIDRSSLKFLELIDYHPGYEDQYLKTLREKAGNSWLNEIDPEQYLNEIRGYDA
ncbi:MAG: hypothetical protein K0B08_02375 [Bacteroidales bacterium]|nr:hypothetical protein [Bacteroidales bacterium]